MTTETQFKEIYDAYSALVYNLALSYVQNSGDAEDLAQEVFVKLYQNLHRHNPSEASLKTWIYRITINHCLDFLKSRKTKKRFGFVTSLFHAGTNEPIATGSNFNHPGVRLEDKEELQTLFRHINALPENQRTALILSRIEEKSQKEVAEIMNTSVKAVESLLQRAKQTLLKKMSGSDGLQG